MSPSNCIFNARTVRLAADPQLEVLDAIVIAATVPMMHLLAWKEVPTQGVFHDEDVFQNVPAVP